MVALLGEAASSRTSPRRRSPRTTRNPDGHALPRRIPRSRAWERSCSVSASPTISRGDARAVLHRREGLKAKTAILTHRRRNDYSVGLGRLTAFRKELRKARRTGDRRTAIFRRGHGFSAQLTQIRASPADVVFVPGYYTDVGLITRQKKSLGVAGTLLGGDGWRLAAARRESGATRSTREPISEAHYSPEDPDPAVRKFVAALPRPLRRRARLHQTLACTDAARLLADAPSGASGSSLPPEDPTCAKLSRHDEREFPGVTGGLTFDLEGATPSSRSRSWKSRRGAAPSLKRLAPAGARPGGGSYFVSISRIVEGNAGTGASAIGRASPDRGSDAAPRHRDDGPKPETRAASCPTSQTDRPPDRFRRLDLLPEPRATAFRVAHGSSEAWHGLGARKSTSAAMKWAGSGAAADHAGVRRFPRATARVGPWTEPITSNRPACVEEREVKVARIAADTVCTPTPGTCCTPGRPGSPSIVRERKPGRALEPEEGGDAAGGVSAVEVADARPCSARLRRRPRRASRRREPCRFDRSGFPFHLRVSSSERQDRMEPYKIVSGGHERLA